MDVVAVNACAFGALGQPALQYGSWGCVSSCPTVCEWRQLKALLAGPAHLAQTAIHQGCQKQGALVLLYGGGEGGGAWALQGRPAVPTRRSPFSLHDLCYPAPFLLPTLTQTSVPTLLGSVAVLTLGG